VINKIFDKYPGDIFRIRNDASPSCKMDYYLKLHRKPEFSIVGDYPKIWLDDKKHPNYLWVHMKDYIDEYSLLHCKHIHILNIHGIMGSKEYDLLIRQLQNLTFYLHIGWLNLEVAGKPEAWKTFPFLEQLCLGGPCQV